MAFNPYEPLPPDLEGGPVSVPISTPNQLGGVVVGRPVDPNDAIAQAAQRARFATRVTTTPTVLDTQPSAAPSPAAQPGPNPIGTPGTPLMAPPTAQPSAAPTPAATPKVHPAHKAVANSIEQDIERAGQEQREAQQAFGEAKQAQGEAAGQALGDARVEHQAQAAELMEAQQKRSQLSAELDAQDAANLKKARDYTIPDFWQGRTGAMVGSAVTMALGGVASAILGGRNQAMDIVQRNVDMYMAKEKEKVDNLYKYAQAQGHLNENTRLRYARELVDLKDQHAAINQSILDHIQEVTNKSQGSVDMAESNKLQSQISEKIIKDREESRMQRAHIGLMAAQAAEARAKAATAGTLNINSKIEEKSLVELNKRMDAYTKEAVGSGTTAGPLTKLQRVEAAKKGLQASLDSGDPNRVAASILSLKEQAGPLLAGGRTTANLSHMMDELGTLQDQAVKFKGKLTGGTPLGQHLQARFQAMLGDVAQESADQLGNIRNRAMKEHLGAGGAASTPRLKDAFLNRLNGITGDATVNGQPLFQEGGASTPSAAPAHPQDNEAIQWAKSNPGDPRSAAILKANGL